MYWLICGPQHSDSRKSQSSRTASNNFSFSFVQFQFPSAEQSTCQGYGCMCYSASVLLRFLGQVSCIILQFPSISQALRLQHGTEAILDVLLLTCWGSLRLEPSQMVRTNNWSFCPFLAPFMCCLSQYGTIMWNHRAGNSFSPNYLKSFSS